MKKFLVSLLLTLVAAPAYAQVTSADLMGLGMPAALADKVASIGTGSAVLANNTYFKASNAAGSANINVLKVDASDETVLNADTGDSILLAIAGTTEVSVKNDELEFAATGTVDATTSIAFAIGGTAEATLTNDQLAFSGAAAEIVPGATSITFKNNADNANNLGIADAGAITIRSTLTSSATSDLGWAVVAGANTACNTTCTSACVFGVNTAATEADIVDCADATADECLCAGAS